MSAERADEWLTEEIRGLLGAIAGPHVAKKRQTAILVGFAKANGTPLKPIFGRPDTCAESIWWGKWSKEPTIAAATEACELRALEWADRETIRVEARFRNERRRKVAQWAAGAPDALASVMADRGQRGNDRINAAVTLMKLADPQETANVGTVAGGVEQSQTVSVDVGRLSDEQLDALARIAERIGGDPD